jgi:hypothetical protein
MGHESDTTGTICHVKIMILCQEASSFSPEISKKEGRIGNTFSRLRCSSSDTLARIDHVVVRGCGMGVPSRATVGLTGAVGPKFHTITSPSSDHEHIHLGNKSEAD